MKRAMTAGAAGGPTVRPAAPARATRPRISRPELWTAAALLSAIAGIGLAIAVPFVPLALVELAALASFECLVGAAIFALTASPRRSAAARRVRIPRGVALPAFALVVPADIVSQVENAIIGFFQTIWSGISSFFGSIFQSIANVISEIFQAPVNAIQSSWVAFESWANSFGPLAPLLTVGMVALVVIIAIFLIWLVIKVTVSEGEQTLGEAEEGA